MNLKLGGYELEAGWSGSGLGSYYSKLEMFALLLCAVLKNSYFRHCFKDHRPFFFQGLYKTS